MNLSKATKRAILSIVAMLVLVAGILQSSGTASAAVVVEKTISCAGGSVTFSYTTQASITNLSSKPAWLSVSSKLNSATSVTYTITASANPNCGSRSFDLYFSGTGETYRIIQYGMGHSTASRTVNPTYTAAGYTESYCQRCGTVFSRTTIDKLKCKVIFDPCNGESTTYKMLETQKAIGNLPVKSGTWTGHTFLGWYTAKSGGTQVTANTTVPAQATYTIYGQWRTNTYTVSFDANGGSGAPASQIKTYNVTLKLSSTKPTRTGYDFVGWGYSKTDTKASFSAGGNYTTNVAIQLYAIWTPAKYTVTFDSQGGSSVASRTVTYNGTYGTSSNQLTNPTRSGYIFDGWYTAKSGGTKVAYTTKVTTASNHTLYAHWTAVYTIKFDPNGGSGAPGNQTKKNGTDLIIPATVPQRTSYTFKGWGTSSTATKVSYAPGDKYKTNAAATLYAVWEPLTFKVYFKDGDKTLTTGTVTYGKTYGTLSKATKTGYYDAKWYTEKTGGKEVTSSTKVTITANQTLYARWIPREYTVTFDSQGGSSVASRTVTFDSTYGTSKNQLPNPTLSGYTFDGWYTAKTGGAKISYTSTVTTASNHTLYAHWKVEVTFDVNGGTGSATKKTFFKGTTYGSLPKGPTAPAGFRFIGWFTSLIGGKQITENTSVGADANAYARYAIDVNFSANGGTGSITGVTYYRGDTYGKLPDAPKAPAGYEFDGWYNMASGGAKISTNTKVTEAYKTLYAHWKAKDIEVTLDYYVGYTETKKFKYNGKYSDLPTPTRSGYTFLGWYIGENGGTKVTTSTTVTTDRDHKLFAHWMKNETLLKTEGGSYTLTVDFFAPNHKWNSYVIANRDATQESNVPNWILDDPKPATNTSKSLAFSYNANTSGEGRTLFVYTYEIGTARAMVYKFAQKAGYMVTYDSKGNLPEGYARSNVMSIEPSVLEKGKVLRLPALEVVGYAFKGWKEKGGYATFDSDYIPDKSISLEAVWKPYKISLDANGGYFHSGSKQSIPTSWCTEIEPNPDDGIVLLEGEYDLPIRARYSFFAWNTKADGTGEFFFPGDNMKDFGSKMTRDVTLYALWNPKKVDILDSANKEGYSYPICVFLKPGETTKVEIDIPAKYWGYYKLNCYSSDAECWIEDQNGKDCYEKENINYFTQKANRISDRTGYYLIHSEKIDKHYVVIRNTKKPNSTSNTPSLISVAVKSNKYEWPATVGQSVVWKQKPLSCSVYEHTEFDLPTHGSTVIYNDVVWEGYICAADVATFLNLEDLATKVDGTMPDNFKDFFFNTWIKEDLLGFLHDTGVDATLSVFSDNLHLSSPKSFAVGAFVSLVSDIDSSWREEKASKQNMFEYLMKARLGYVPEEVEPESEHNFFPASDSYLSFGTGASGLLIESSPRTSGEVATPLTEEELNCIFSIKSKETITSLISGMPKGKKVIPLLRYDADKEGSYGVHFTIMRRNGGYTLITDDAVIHKWSGDAISIRPGLVGEFDQSFDTLEQAVLYLEHPETENPSYKYIPADKADADHYLMP